MNLQPTLVDIVSQKEFLRSTNDIQFKTGGATLDVEKFSLDDDGYIPAGTAVMKDEDGLYIPFASGGEEGATTEGEGLTASEIYGNAGNAIVGVLIAGHPIEDKCHGVDDAFKEAVKGYLRFDV